MSKLVWKILIVGLVGLVLGLSLFNSRKGRNDMNLVEAELIEEGRIPAIDALASAETKTATFALG